jgi:gas vesicle protein
VAYIFKYIIGFVIGLIIAVFASLIAFKKGIEHRRKVAEEAIGSAEEEAKRIIIEAERQAEGKKREYLLMAKEEIHKSKLNLEKEVRERRNELARQERRLIQKEEAIDKKTIELEGRSKELDLREEKINEAKANIERIEEQQLVRPSRSFFKAAGCQHAISDVVKIVAFSVRASFYRHASQVMLLYQIQNGFVVIHIVAYGKDPDRVINLILKSVFAPYDFSKHVQSRRCRKTIVAPAVIADSPAFVQ